MAGVISSQVAKPAKPAPSRAILSIARAGTSFGPHLAEEIGVGNEKILDSALFGDCRKRRAVFYQLV